MDIKTYRIEKESVTGAVRDLHLLPINFNFQYQIELKKEDDSSIIKSEVKSINIGSRIGNNNVEMTEDQLKKQEEYLNKLADITARYIQELEK